MTTVSVILIEAPVSISARFVGFFASAWAAVGNDYIKFLLGPSAFIAVAGYVARKKKESKGGISDS